MKKMPKIKARTNEMGQKPSFGPSSNLNILLQNFDPKLKQLNIIGSQGSHQNTTSHRKSLAEKIGQRISKDFVQNQNFEAFYGSMFGTSKDQKSVSPGQEEILSQQNFQITG
jgi:hypothetical protein